MISRFLLCVLLVHVAAEASIAREPKEYDKDVIYEESQVPAFDLPPLLVSSEGMPITSAEEWFRIRRPQIMALFGNLVYGTVPEPPSLIETTFEVVRTQPEFMDGVATRKDVRIRFRNSQGSAEMLVLVFVPNAPDRPVPAFLMHSFDNTHGDGFDPHPTQPGRLRNGWPIGELFRRGFGFVVVYQQDLVDHNDVSFSRGIHRLFYREGQSFPKASEWGVLSAVAWGASRAMDYLETDDDLDASRVAIMGHSKMGKATLWTAAQDKRFALAISAQSGCAGGGVWHANPGKRWRRWSLGFPTGFAATHGSLSIAKMICLSTSTCCSPALRRGLSMCTVA